jgi:hypothetical protein
MTREHYDTLSLAGMTRFIDGNPLIQERLLSIISREQPF